ncbi:MAG: hypothetical protein Q4A55_07575 [Aerococcus sp.]|nr:hypothetical protein [Aerococcus sp.]
MIKGKTKSGFEFEVSEDAIQDMYLLEEIAQVDENPLSVTHILTRLLGDEQKKRLYKHVENEQGHALVEDVMFEFGEIMNASAELKNS